MITEYGTEVYYEDKKIEKFFGTKIIKERKERKVVKKQFSTYVEEINGKYYDVVTGKEVYKSKDRRMKEISKCSIEKRNGEYYFSCCQGAKVNKEDVENEPENDDTDNNNKPDSNDENVSDKSSDDDTPSNDDDVSNDETTNDDENRSTSNDLTKKKERDKK